LAHVVRPDDDLRTNHSPADKAGIGRRYGGEHRGRGLEGAADMGAPMSLRTRPGAATSPKRQRSATFAHAVVDEQAAKTRSFTHYSRSAEPVFRGDRRASIRDSTTSRLRTERGARDRQILPTFPCRRAVASAESDQVAERSSVMPDSVP